MKVYKVVPLPDYNSCIETDPRTIITWLEEAEVGDGFRIEVLEMSRAELDALPEYMGP